MSNVNTIQRVYGAFGRGDVAAILEMVSDDADWEYIETPADVPWLQRRRGKQGVAAFFQSVAGLEMHRFVPKAFFEHENKVFSVLDIEFTVIATGKKLFEEDEIHIWKFNPDGKISGFRHRADTHAHHLAARK
ncbi:MAG: nuclear transport factor 2 family protein [Acidobacteriota bacterium]